MIRRIGKELAGLRFYWIGLLILGALAWLAAGTGPFGLPVAGSPDTSARLSPEAAMLAQGSFLKYESSLLVIVAILQVLVFHLIGALSFGGEFAHHTMARLLAQPVPRSRIWVEKSVAHLLIVVFALVGNLHIGLKAIQGVEIWDAAFARTPIPIEDFIDGLTQPWFVFTTCGALLSLASGPFLALTLRQTHTAFWASLVAPVFAASLFGLVDYSIIFHWVGFSITDWLNAALYGVFGEFNLMAIFTAVWFPLFFAAGWFVFRRLEV